MVQRIIVQGKQLWLEVEGVQVGERISVAWGRGGLSSNKQEGDGATPVGVFPLGRVFYNPSREVPPETSLEVVKITKELGWCDDPLHSAYNTLVSLPFVGRHEVLWREDHLYDVFLEIKYNDDPVVAGKGSAIFLHMMPPSGKTEGCIAMERGGLLALLSRICLGCVIEIRAIS